MPQAGWQIVTACPDPDPGFRAVASTIVAMSGRGVEGLAQAMSHPATSESDETIAASGAEHWQ